MLRVLVRSKFRSGSQFPTDADSQVDSADQLTHDMALDAENLKAEPGLDVFKADPEYAAHEKEYEVRAPVSPSAHVAVFEQTFGCLRAGITHVKRLAVSRGFANLPQDICAREALCL